MRLMRVAQLFDANESCQASGADRYDLHMAPEALNRIETALSHAPLRSLLTNLNDRDSLFTTFASKVWTYEERRDAEPSVFASRVDLLFLSEAINFGRGPLQDLARRLAELLESEPGEAIRAELRVAPAELAGENEGFCLRLLLFARGATQEQAELRWGFGLARVQQALLFVARTLRQEASSVHS